MGSAKDRAKAEFRAAREALKARTTPEQRAAAYREMNVREPPGGDVVEAGLAPDDLEAWIASKS
jgi:hypothetical protein